LIRIREVTTAIGVLVSGANVGLAGRVNRVRLSEGSVFLRFTSHRAHTAPGVVLEGWSGVTAERVEGLREDAGSGSERGTGIRRAQSIKLIRGTV
jgi:hypothetical protein